MRKILFCFTVVLGLTFCSMSLAGAAGATTQKCHGAIVHDVFTAHDDNGHGTPAVWAKLTFKRSVTITCAHGGGYNVALKDVGGLWTIAGAGTPNGTGGQIANAVPGSVVGVYLLKVKGALAVPSHRDTSLTSTAYIKSLFGEGAEVKGGFYRWDYRTVCHEHWTDASTNNDGQGAAAGNITGKRCVKHPHPSPTPTTSSPTPTPTATTPTDDATPSPTGMPVGAPQTGDGSGGGGGTALMAAGAGIVVIGAGSGLLLWRRRQQH